MTSIITPSLIFYHKIINNYIYLKNVNNINIIERIQKIFGENPDLVIRKVKINILHKIYVIFFDTLANQDKINEYILKKLTNLNNIDNLESLIPGSNFVKLKSFEEIEYYLYNGFTIIVNKNKL